MTRNKVPGTLVVPTCSGLQSRHSFPNDNCPCSADTRQIDVHLNREKTPRPLCTLELELSIPMWRPYMKTRRRFMLGVELE
jgi:hypothetical protein